MRPQVTILLGTFNGADHLPAQLASFERQRGCDWSLWVSDDGSSDATRDILEQFRSANPDRKIRLLAGAGQGAAVNYLSMLLHPELPPGPVALADQDDVWLGGKLARALRRIARAERGGRPVLYGAESFLATEALVPYQRSRAHVRPSFGNALVQNLFGGHSIVLNEPALALVRRAGMPDGVPYHDWWLYLLLAAAGAECVLDPLPVVLYRQHRGNALGAPTGAGAAIRRMVRIAGADYGRWIDRNIAALDHVTPLLDEPAVQLLQAVKQARFRVGPARAIALRRLGVRRDTLAGDLALFLAAMTGRV